MRNSVRRRPIQAALATFVLLAGVSLGALAPSASAAPLVTLAGAAPAVTHGPGTITFTYTVVAPTGIGSTLLTTDQPPSLPALTAGVLLDGVAVPTAQVTRPDTLNIAIQTGAAATDGLPAGTHTISFVAVVPTGASLSTTSSATLAYTSGATPLTVTAAAVPVALNEPDIAVETVLPPTSTTPASLGTGQEGGVIVAVANLGYGVPLTTVTITLPPHVTLGPDGVVRETDDEDVTGDGEDDGTPVDCTTIAPSPVQLSCPIGLLTHVDETSDSIGTAFLDVSLITDEDPPVGQTAAVTVAAAVDAGQGTDTDLTNNTVSPTLRYTGIAALTFGITSGDKHVQLGQQTTITFSIHNDGPQPADATAAFISLTGGHLTALSFTGNTTPPAGSDPDLEAVRAAVLGRDATAMAATARVSTAATAEPIGIISFPGGALVPWFVGTIAPGATARAVLTVKAESTGSDMMQFAAFASAANPNCPNLDCDPTALSVAAVPVVKTTPTPTVTASPLPGTTAPAAGPELANTGTDTTPLLVGGTALLVLGSVLIGAGRRRRYVGVDGRERPSGRYR